MLHTDPELAAPLAPGESAIGVDHRESVDKHGAHAEALITAVTPAGVDGHAQDESKAPLNGEAAAMPHDGDRQHVFLITELCGALACLASACVFVLGSAAALCDSLAQNDGLDVRAAQVICCRSAGSQRLLWWVLLGFAVGFAVHLWVIWACLRLGIYSTIAVTTKNQLGWCLITVLLFTAVGLRRHMCGARSGADAQQPHAELSEEARARAWAMARVVWLVTGLTFALTAVYCWMAVTGSCASDGLPSSGGYEAADVAAEMKLRYTVPMDDNPLSLGDRLLCTRTTSNEACVGSIARPPSSYCDRGLDGIADWVKTAVPEAEGFGTEFGETIQSYSYRYDERSRMNTDCDRLVVLLSRGFARESLADSYFWMLAPGTSDSWRWDGLKLYAFPYQHKHDYACTDSVATAQWVTGALMCWLAGSCACWWTAHCKRPNAPARGEVSSEAADCSI